MQATMASSSSASSASAAHLLHQASELNEDGIYELSSGRSMLAIGHLEEAMGHLLQCFGLPQSSSSSSCAAHTTCRVQIPHLEDDLFYIYACAVSYTPPQPTDTSTGPSQSDLVFGLATVLFNLALAHHQQAKSASCTKHQHPNEEGASLRQALTYYKECHQALQALDDTTDTNDDLLLMTLAVLNNQAQILYELDERHSSSTSSSSSSSPEEDPVFQKLLTCSMHAIMSADENENLSMVEQSQIHEFVQNAMVFRLQRPCAAPSA